MAGTCAMLGFHEITLVGTRGECCNVRMYGLLRSCYGYTCYGQRDTSEDSLPRKVDSVPLPDERARTLLPHKNKRSHGTSKLNFRNTKLTCRRRSRHVSFVIRLNVKRCGAAIAHA